MITSRASYLKGQKSLEKTMLIFYIIFPFIIGTMLYFLNNYLISNNPVILCETFTCVLNSNEVNPAVSINSSYYILLLSIISFFAFILFSSYIVWVNADNTYNHYNSLSAKLISVVFAFLAFSLLLFFIFILFIPSESAGYIWRDFLLGIY
jgi:hypothetical protein